MVLLIMPGEKIPIVVIRGAHMEAGELQLHILQPTKRVMKRQKAIILQFMQMVEFLAMVLPI